MSCNSYITGAQGLSCRNSTGGLKNIFLFENGEGLTYTSGAAGITAITAPAATDLFEWKLPRATSNFQEVINASTENGSLFYEATLTFSLLGLSQERQDELRLLAANPAVRLIIEDQTGNYWLMGKSNGSDVQTSTLTTGTAFADKVGYEVVMLAQEPYGVEKLDVADQAAFEALFTGGAPDNITLVKA